jgi:predicted XRE-type DNA-binding protein
MNNTIRTADDFLNEVLIPAKMSNVSSKEPWILKDAKHKNLLISDSFAVQLGYDNHTQLMNSSMADLAKTNQNSLNHLMHQELRAIKEKKVIHCILAFEQNTTTVAIIASIIPIFFQNEVVALEIPSKFLNQSQFNLELFLSINSVQTNSTPKSSFTKNRIEEHIIYLMMLKKTQEQIAKLLNVSRSRVSQRIAMMCHRASIPGYSAKLLIERAFLANYHKRIPLELFFINLA